ncbi:tetratricopeptide repeat protein [Roseiflexus castenholzii]|uniref:Tetratricopeptide TPR_2 repeat protein n=1 Tax=Roseiflexus castenholzii (strain DSM 13941 / HLO8) TaxID=383372 RepID=A7NHC6_ROSCS|nr:tetratricopeptide repeat protein [Roseiflexus castenholzii]ABU56873.1 Tetratricopeptide TPR_2 repeat protein [Roseiflexus castenholzii DSM 13941]
MTTTTNDWLQQGIAAARAGQRAQARQFFVRAIQENQYNDDAWVWLAGVVDNPADMRRCLQQALRINPLNPQARQGIAWLDRQTRQAQKASSSATNMNDGQKPSSSATAHSSVQAENQVDKTSSQNQSHSPATDGSLSVSQSSASAKPASAHDSHAPGTPEPAPKPARRFSWFGKSKPAHSAVADDSATVAAAPQPARRFSWFDRSAAPTTPDEAAGGAHGAKPARRFSWFGKSKPAHSAVADDSATVAAAPQPARRFSWFDRSAAPAAPATPDEAPGAASTAQPARRFSWFGKSNAVAKPMVAAAATATVAGAAGATPPASAAPPAAPGAKPRRKEKVLPPEEGDPARDCCPYCGELNKPDRQWCRRCDRSLMIRGPVRDQRSPWLSILGILWVLGGVLGILGAIAGLIVALALYNSARGSLSDFPLVIVVVFVIIALLYGGQIAIARAMMNRARWAYWIIAVVTVLQLGGSLFGALGAIATIGNFITQAQAFLPSQEAVSAVAAFTSLLGTIIMVDVGIKAFFMLLVGLSWRDFYGPKERFVSEVRGATDYELFNIGLALQRKGMWWMAMKQWEAAVANSPRDVDYLHALTVAYAKLEQWDKARETIARAITVAPDNQALKQVQERIERMSAA